MRQKLSTEGRIVIPLEIRKQMGIKAGDQLELVYDSATETITVKSDKLICSVCKSDHQLIQIFGTQSFICPSCLKTILTKMNFNK